LLVIKAQTRYNA